MQIKRRQRLEGDRERIVLVPDSLDDLWHLKHVLEPDDLVSGETTRRIQRDDDTLRSTGGEREHMSVTIRITDVSFHKFSNRLRLAGEIVRASREDQIGFNHTLNVEVHDELSVEKVFKSDQLKRLYEAEEATTEPDIAIATIEEGQAHIHTVAQYGIEEYASLRGSTGKGDYARSRSELFSELADALSHLDVDALILAGPGFTKDDAYSHIEDNKPDLVPLITLVDTSSAGERGVHEVLKRGAVEDVRVTTRIAREAAFIDELMQRIGEGAKAAYGIDEVSRAVEYGAVERLLILDERIREERGVHGTWSVDVNNLITTVEQKGGEVTVFSSEFDPGTRLRNLGGVAAFLRYRLS